ncbi:hypothetical protein [Bosea sp. PAMC 26642]|uniref:hypothetical protein n=1 Tax=Bosea sp. (strain PAMC 26642) TaxID=1792307 RepID=UPI0007703647|nr:hypothetical protein [Bosea sp. PAMC 26642]AMJ60734.1 hypothetical protein AXW83_10930 [Bosea sp. PAMC 26642]
MENRAAERWRARLRSASLLDGKGQLLVECRVLDKSRMGAKLKPDSVRPLPVQVNYLGHETDEVLPASIVWVRDGLIGIRFQTPG